MNRSFTLGQRIALGASILVFFVFLASGLGLWYTNTSANTLALTQERIEQVNRIAQLEMSLGDLVTTIDGMLLSRQNTNYSEQLMGQLAVFDEQVQSLESAPIASSAASEQAVANLLYYSEEIDSVARTILSAAEQRQWARAQVTRHTELASLERRFGEDLQQLRQNVERNSTQLVADAEAQQSTIGSLLTAGALMAAVTGALLAFMSIRSITGPVRALTERVQRVTEGNFAFVPPMDRSDEIGSLSRSFSLMTEWLQDSYHALEDRVRERTADLALASEVAQTLGRVRDMDELLQKSVDLVRERFDLYYVQVYLMSEDGRRLVLRAGTGSVGQELLRRGFQLPVDRYSINGTAALDRHPVIIPDTEDSGIFRPNPLLPDTLSEMAIPLLAGDRVVGVLDLQSSRRHSLSEENLPAFGVLSGQLAIAIENAYLFQDVDRARAEMEQQMSQRVSEQWQEFLDAVRRSEEIGFAYSQGTVTPATGSLIEEGSERSVLQTPLTLFDTQIGSIQLKGMEDSPWSDQAREMVRVVARQVAQQVENLRLLAEAERYQLEAEAAVRRLTREGWQQYVDGAAQGKASYLYDGRQVVEHSNGFGENGLTQPLLIRGEPIGELLVEGDDSVLEEDAVSLISEVAGHLSSHLENLRLTQQTEQALAEARRRSEELELLNQIVTEISGTLELKESLEIVVDQLVATTAADQARIALLNEQGNTLTVVAEQYDEKRTTSALGLVIPVEANELTQQVLESRKAVYVVDAQHDPSTKAVHDMLAEQGIHSLLLMPILAGQEVIGTVGMDILEPDKRFSENEMQLSETMVFQAAAAIQNAQLFDQVQSALAETRALYQAGAELNRARTYDDVLAVVRRHTIAGEGDASVSITLFDSPWTENRKPQMLEVLASWSPLPAPAEASMTRISMDQFPAAERLMQRDRSMLVRDVKTDPRLDAQSRKILLGSNARSIISMPMLVGGQWIGHLNVTYAEPFTFDDHDPELQRLRTLVTQASVAVQSINLLDETTRLLESEQRRRRLSDTLVRVTGRMLDVMDEQQIRAVIADEIQNLTAPDQLSLYEWLPGRDVLRVDIRKVRGHDQSGEVGGKLINRRQRTDLWQVVDSGEMLLRELTDPEEQVRQHYVLPWMVGTERAGVIELVTAPDSSIREEDRASIEGIVEQAAVRLQNARLYAESELRAEEMAALNEMSQVLTAQRDVGAVLDTVYRFASRLMDTSNFYVALQEPGESLLRFPIFIQDGERMDWPDREPGNGLTEYVLRERQPLLIEGQAEQRIAEMGLEVAGRPARSWLGVPMLYGDDVTGVLAVRDLEVVSRYDRHDQDLLGAMANAAAIALQNARLFEETQQQAAETESLYQAGRQINTAENYKEILGALRDHTILGNGSHSVSIEYFDRPWLEDDDSEEVRPEWVEVLARWTTLPVEHLQTRYPLDQFAISETLINAHEATVMQDIAQDLRLDERTRALLTEYLGAASAIFVPLVVGGQWVGLMTAVYSEKLEYSEDQLRQLQSLAGQAATAVHSLRLLEQAQNRARRERVLREITERVRSATDVDVIMKTAVREVGRALGREAFVYLSEEQRMKDHSAAIALEESS